MSEKQISRKISGELKGDLRKIYYNYFDFNWYLFNILQGYHATKDSLENRTGPSKAESHMTPPPAV